MTWKKMIDQFKDTIVFCTLTDSEMAVDFDDSYGGTEGESFTAWSEKWVYFPICYDGAEWIDRAPRNPCDYSCGHAGGG